MSDIRSIMLEAKKNVAPLLSTSMEDRKSKGEVVLIHPKLNTVMSKLMKHRGQDLAIETSKKKAEFSWLKMKEKMTLEMEYKRCQEWEKNSEYYKKMNQEDEEEDFEMEEDGENDEDGDDGEDRDEVDDKETDGDEDNDEDKVDQNDVDNNDEEKIDQSDDDDEIDSIVLKRKKSIRVVDDDDDDDDSEEKKAVDEADSYDNDYDDEVYADDEDDLDLSFTTQLKAEYQKTYSKPARTENQIDSQFLLDLCSGTFGDDDDEDFGNDNADDDDKDVDDEDIALNKDAAKMDSSSRVIDLFEDAYRSEPESEPVDDEEEKGKNEAREDMNEEEEIDEEEEVNEEAEEVLPKKKKRSIKQFFEDEAELSGSDQDVSSDEDEDDEENEYEQEEILENLPSDHELRGQLEKIHNKNMLEEEKRQLMILKERFFEDGDLHDGRQRSKKFEWDLNKRELEEFTNVLSDSEGDDSESGGEEDDTQNDSKVIRLKRRIEEVIATDNNSNQEEEVEVTSVVEEETTEATTTIAKASGSKQKITLANFEKELFKPTVPRKTSKISAFVMRDRRLTAVLSKKTDQLIVNGNKRLKSNESKSIFDQF